MKSKKKNTPGLSKPTILLVMFAVFFAILMLFLYEYPPNIHRSKEQKPPSHTMPYVDGSAATEQVQNAYDSYINPKRTLAQRKVLIAAFGSRNLVFYNEYYQHGFDPITCSSTLPLKATATLASTGPVSKVSVAAEYPDGSIATISTTVVLNSDGMQIDSVTCPGDKGNLPPRTTP